MYVSFNFIFNHNLIVYLVYYIIKPFNFQVSSILFSIKVKNRNISVQIKESTALAKFLLTFLEVSTFYLYSLIFRESDKTETKYLKSVVGTSKSFQSIHHDGFQDFDV